MCFEDLLIATWIVGGSGLAIIGYKLVKQKKAKTNANTKPGTDHDDHPVSAK